VCARSGAPEEAPHLIELALTSLALTTRLAKLLGGVPELAQNWQEKVNFYLDIFNE
jgi:hypothetical protein